MTRQEEFESIDTVVKLFERSVAMYGDRPLIYEKKNGKYEPTTYAEVKAEAQNFGAALMAYGIEKGDRIALMAEGRKDWLVAELGMFYAGAVNVPLSVKLDADTDITFRLSHSGARMVIVSGTQAKKVESIKAQTPEVEKIIYLDNTPEAAEALSFEQMKVDGSQWLTIDANRVRFEATVANIGANDLANISYTSGTTADPKGIMLSQHNYAANTMQSCTRISLEPTAVTLTILPWDHSFAHTACLYCFIYYGAAIAAQEIGRTPIETLKNIPKNINEIRPHLMMSVPALSKAFRKNIENGIRQKGQTTWKLFEFFRKAAYIYNGDGHNRGRGLRWLLAPVVALGDRLVMSKVRQSFGGRLQYFIGGGALLDIELQRFFAAVGMPIMQGYGLSEASPVISTNALASHKFGSSGRVVDFMELRICDNDGHELAQGEKGEIVIRGHNTMKGYWRNPSASAESLRNGWLHTGDMGLIDEDGFLVVLGRFKSLLIGNDGEKYSPEGIEESLVELSPYIDQCMLYNNQCAYTSGLVVPNVGALKAALKAEGLDIMTDKGLSRALDLIQESVGQFKAGGRHAGMFPERWLPAAVVVLPEAFTEQNKMLNSTMKMVRGKVCERFAHELDFAYRAEAKNMDNALNRANLKQWM